MISKNQKLMLVAIVVIVSISIGLGTIRNQADIDNREAVASVFIGEELAAEYVRLGLGNCEFAKNRRGTGYVAFRKRRVGDFKKCEKIAKIRARAILQSLSEDPTPQKCYSYVKPHVPLSMSESEVKAACRYFLEYDYG